MDVGLLEGIKGFFLDGTPIAEAPKEKRMEKSIIDHLNLLFNERSDQDKEEAGSGKSRPRYGMPDMSTIFIDIKKALNKEQRSEILRRTLENAVKNFEPRLTHVRVENDKDVRSYAEHKLAFLLHAQIAASDDVNFRTTFSLAEPALVEPHKAKAAS